MRPLVVMARETDGVLEGLLTRLQHVERVESLDDVRAVLERHRFDGPTALDLLGHSTTAARLLQLGRSIIDMCDPRIARFFEALARDGVLQRKGVGALRLLGCQTATMPGGQHTMRRLASTLRVPVYGTTKRLGKNHYDARGFDVRFAHLLVEAAALPVRQLCTTALREVGDVVGTRGARQEPRVLRRQAVATDGEVDLHEARGGHRAQHSRT